MSLESLLHEVLNKKLSPLKEVLGRGEPVLRKEPEKPKRSSNESRNSIGQEALPPLDLGAC
jgi:hypothetical protein